MPTCEHTPMAAPDRRLERSLGYALREVEVAWHHAPSAACDGLWDGYQEGGGQWAENDAGETTAVSCGWPSWPRWPR